MKRMKRHVYILAAAVLAAAFLGTGCDSRLDPTNPDDLIPVNFVVAPAVYGDFSRPQTRADYVPIDLKETKPGGTHENHNNFSGEPEKKYLPEGTILWMTYQKGTKKSAYANASESQLLDHPEYFTWGEQNLKPYIVRISEGGWYSLYPLHSKEISGGYLEVDTDDLENYTNLLLLEAGYYQFRVITPAYRIKKSDLSMQVDNGMFLYSHDERYVQTKSKVFHVKAANESNNYTRTERTITLNPIISQVARFEIRLHRGANVSRLEMMPQGIEISGLQNPEANASGTLLYKWNSVNLADTLVMKKADKNARVSIQEFEVNESTGYITGETAFLPTDAMSTNVYILLDVAVNGIPTQYIVTITQMKFYHGHSYELDLEIGRDGNINVMNWANQSSNMTISVP